jgi:hypothetical protein
MTGRQTTGIGREPPRDMSSYLWFTLGIGQCQKEILGPSRR